MSPYRRCPGTTLRGLRQDEEKEQSRRHSPCLPLEIVKEGSWTDKLKTRRTFDRKLYLVWVETFLFFYKSIPSATLGVSFL